MLSKIKERLNFFREHRYLTITVLFILVALNTVIFLSYFGTTRIINRNVDSTAEAALEKTVQNVQDKLSECQLYVRLLSEGLSDQRSMEQKMADIDTYSEKISTIFSTHYIGTYVEYAGQVYSSGEIPPVKNANWYTRCRDNPDIAGIYISQGKTLDDSYISAALYNSDTGAVCAMLLDADILVRYINRIDSTNSTFNAFILDTDGKLMYSTNESYAEPYNAFLSTKKGGKLISRIAAESTGKCSIKLGSESCTGYYRGFLGDWTIMLFAGKSALFRSLYLFNMMQYVVIMLIFVLFIFFFVRSYNSSISLERALKTRSAFLTNMSHEIRTPLNAIIGMSEILLRRDVHGAARNDVVAIHNAGTGLLAIINDILDYSKMESGGFKIIDDEYDLPGLISEVVSLVSFRIKNQDVRLLVNINPAVPKRLIGDEVRIKQILVNLLGNAVKFTERGYIVLSVDWDFINNGETTLTLKVSDTGIGIAENEAKLLFDEFTQADAGAKSKHHGTGLGLYISKNLAQQMGGSISLESTIGKGSTFTVTVKNKVENYAPFAAVAGDDLMLGIYEKDLTLAELLAVSFEMLHVNYRIIETPYDPEQFKDLTHLFFRRKWKNEVGKVLNGLEKGPLCILLTELNDDSEEDEDIGIKKLMINLFGLQIAECLNGEVKYFDRYSGFDTGEIVTIQDARALIVDDNITNMAVAKGILAEYNIVIDTAVNGAQAIEKIESNHYDIVFMDNMMPVMDGVEATQRIRAKEDPYFKNLPIIALTALAGRGDRERFQSLGFNEFLSKPIDLNKMDIILHKFLQNKIKDIYDISTAKTETITIEPDLVIDTEAGIRQIGQDKESYANILTIYIQDMEKRYDQLINESDLEKNTINFHAIKGSSANVGAYRLNEMAAEMEKLGKAGKSQEVDILLEQFLQLLNLTIQTAKEYISEYKGIQNKSKGYKYGIESHYINEILFACKDMDMIKIEDVYEKITRFVYPARIMDILENMRLASFEYDYDKIEMYAKQLKSS